MTGRHRDNHRRHGALGRACAARSIRHGALTFILLVQWPRCRPDEPALCAKTIRSQVLSKNRQRHAARLDRRTLLRKRSAEQQGCRTRAATRSRPRDLPCNGQEHADDNLVGARRGNEIAARCVSQSRGERGLTPRLNQSSSSARRSRRMIVEMRIVMILLQRFRTPRHEEAFSTFV
jgi:hypothetical protein